MTQPFGQNGSCIPLVSGLGGPEAQFLLWPLITAQAGIKKNRSQTVVFLKIAASKHVSLKLFLKKLSFALKKKVISLRKSPIVPCFGSFGSFYSHCIYKKKEYKQ